MARRTAVHTGVWPGVFLAVVWLLELGERTWTDSTPYALFGYLAVAGLALSVVVWAVGMVLALVVILVRSRGGSGLPGRMAVVLVGAALGFALHPITLWFLQDWLQQDARHL